MLLFNLLIAAFRLLQYRADRECEEYMMFENELEILKALQGTRAVSNLGPGINLLERLNAGQVSEKGLHGILDFLPTFSQIGERMARHREDEIWPEGMAKEISSKLSRIVTEADRAVYQHRCDLIYKANKTFWEELGIESIPGIGSIPGVPEINPGLLEFLATGRGLAWRICYIPAEFNSHPILPSQLFWDFDDENKINAHGIRYRDLSNSRMEDQPKTLERRKSFLRSPSIPGWYALEDNGAYDLEENNDRITWWMGKKQARITGRMGKTLSEIKEIKTKLAEFLQIPDEVIGFPSAEEQMLFIPRNELGSLHNPVICRNQAENDDGTEVDGVVLGSEYTHLSPSSDFCERPIRLMHAELFRPGQRICRFMIRLDNLVGLPFKKPERQRAE